MGCNGVTLYMYWNKKTIKIPCNNNSHLIRESLIREYVALTCSRIVVKLVQHCSAMPVAP